MNQTVQVRGLSKSFRDGGAVRTVLHDVALDVPMGAMAGVVGRSGCGKSTLLWTMAGLLPPDAGSIHLCGHEIDYGDSSALAKLRRDLVGFVAQDFGLIGSDSIEDNIALPLRFGRARPSARERARLVAAAAEQAALPLSRRRRARDLSQGERQRVALARALVRSPRVLIADEPTAALDEVTAGEVIHTLGEIADRGAIVIVATHDPAVTAACTMAFRVNNAAVSAQNTR